MEEEKKIETETTAEAVKEKKTIRDTLYGRIDVSVKTMDRVIGVLLIALVVSLICGVIF